MDKGSTFGEIKKVDLENLKPTLPYPEEQRRILKRIEVLVSGIKARRLRQQAREETGHFMQATPHEGFSRAEERSWSG
ncbi:MAG: hypothetical protein ACUVQM_04340 [Candidatus Hadarchaeaceae archaeon]